VLFIQVFGVLVQALMCETTHISDSLPWIACIGAIDLGLVFNAMLVGQVGPVM
jgi:hypothetical protein